MSSAGKSAEDLAADHVQRAGLRILARNVSCRGGEIDLIAEDRGRIVFIEVRLRRNGRFGGAAASITPSKQRKIAIAAQHWLQTEGRAHANKPCRFDAILFDSLDADRLEWLQAAFETSDLFS